MNDLATQTAPDLRLPLRHLLVGAVSLVLAALMLVVLGPGTVFYPIDNPHALTVTHLITLGWITLTIMGASYQMVPVVLQVRLWSEPLGHVAFWLFAPGTGLLVAGFWIFWPPLLALGGSLAVAGMTVYAYNMLRTLARVARWGLYGPFFAGSVLYLLAVGGLGLTLAVNFIWPFLGGAATMHLGFHVLIGLFGWITLLAMGVAYKLGPMFALSHGRGDGYGSVVFVLAAGGLLLLLAVLSVYPARMPIAAAALVPLAGVLLFLYDQWLYFRHRNRPRLDLGLRFMVAAFAYLGIAAALAWVDVAGWLRVPPTALVVLGLFGWAGCLISGQLYKIVPFLVWYDRYGHRAGLEPVPLLRDMYSARWGEVNLWSFGPAGALLALGAGLGNAVLVEVGGLAALAGGLMLAGNLYRMLRA